MRVAATVMKMTSGKLTIDDVKKTIEAFDRVCIEPVQKAFVVSPAYYEEAKELFNKCGVKVVKSQSIDPKVVGYLMDEDNAEKCIEKEKQIARER